MTDEQQIRAAAASVRSARQAIHTATQRRTATVAAAQDLAEAARAAERAEQDAARTAAAVAIHRLTATHLTTPQIAVIVRSRPTKYETCRRHRSGRATSPHGRRQPEHRYTGRSPRAPMTYPSTS